MTRVLPLPGQAVMRQCPARQRRPLIGIELTRSRQQRPCGFAELRVWFGEVTVGFVDGRAEFVFEFGSPRGRHADARSAASRASIVSSTALADLALAGLAAGLFVALGASGLGFSTQAAKRLRAVWMSQMVRARRSS